MAEDKVPPTNENSISDLDSAARGSSTSSHKDYTTIDISLTNAANLQEAEEDEFFNRPDPITSLVKSTYDFAPDPEEARYPNSSEIEDQVGHRSFDHTTGPVTKLDVEQRSVVRFWKPFIFLAFLSVAIFLIAMMAPKFSALFTEAEFEGLSVPEFEGLSVPEFDSSFLPDFGSRNGLQEGSYTGFVVYTDGSPGEEVVVHVGSSNAVIMARKFCNQGQLDLQSNMLTCGAKPYRIETRSNQDTIVLEVYESLFRIAELRLKIP